MLIPFLKSRPNVVKRKDVRNKIARAGCEKPALAKSSGNKGVRSQHLT